MNDRNCVVCVCVCVCVYLDAVGTVTPLCSSTRSKFTVEGQMLFISFHCHLSHWRRKKKRWSIVSVIFKQHMSNIFWLHIYVYKNTRRAKCCVSGGSGGTWGEAVVQILKVVCRLRPPGGINTHLWDSAPIWSFFFTNRTRFHSQFWD